MATNTGSGSRRGTVKDRTQIKKPGTFVKRNMSDGELMDVKSSDKPFKGVAQERDKRRKQEK